MKSRSEPVAIDLFCGAGGLSYGMKQAGITINAGIDIDPACRHPFEANVKARFHRSDLAELSPMFVASLFPEDSMRVLAGCAPCQPFSAYTKGRFDRKDQWQLLHKFGDLVASCKPEIVTMENVPRLTRHTVFEDFLAVLDEEGYSYNYEVVRCAEYGVPQSRGRLVLLASRLGDIRLLPPNSADSEFVTVEETIRHLGELKAGDTSSSDPLHKSSGLSPRNLQRIRKSRPGGTWRDWDEGLQAACHTRETGRTYPSVYGRMRWDQPAPTITTQFHGYGNGRFGHPTQDRAISLREGALSADFS